jgi:hypothetical protein
MAIRYFGLLLSNLAQLLCTVSQKILQPGAKIKNQFRRTQHRLVAKEPQYIDGTWTGTHFHTCDDSSTYQPLFSSLRSFNVA